MMKRKVLMNSGDMHRALTRMCYEIIERNKDLDHLVLVGIETRGVFLAERMAKRLSSIEDLSIPTYPLNIQSYRDDIAPECRAAFEKREVSLDFTDKHVILVDDVLYTGRSIRAGLDAIMDLGRPQKISLAVLIDRGHRELPIRADYVGKNIPTSKQENVVVHMEEVDDKDLVYLTDQTK